MESISFCFIIEDQGVTAVEYALIASLIFIVIVVGVTALGIRSENLYNDIAAAM